MSPEKFHPVLVVTATRVEQNALAVGFGISAPRSARGQLLSFRCSGTAFSLVHTGMGCRPTREVLDSILDKNSFGSLIDAGYCGGLHQETGKTGLILYQESLLQEEEGSSPISFPADPGLLNLVTRSLHDLSQPYSAGRGLTVNRVVSRREEKHALGRRWGCCAVDMESAVVCQMAANKGFPCLSMRVVLDASDQELPDFSGRISPQGNFMAKSKTSSFCAQRPQGNDQPGKIAHWKDLEKKARKELENLGKILPQIMTGGPA